MSIIKDSGERREFISGAVRDLASGKGRCDLLPLRQIAVMTNDVTFCYFADFISTGDINNLRLILQRHIEERLLYKTILTLSVHFENGAQKYDERNWEKGIPIHCFLDSGIRHYLKHLDGQIDEDHYIAFIWNVICCWWTIENKPEMNDLPINRKE